MRKDHVDAHPVAGQQQDPAQSSGESGGKRARRLPTAHLAQPDGQRVRPMGCRAGLSLLRGQRRLASSLSLPVGCLTTAGANPLEIASWTGSGWQVELQTSPGTYVGTDFAITAQAGYFIYVQAPVSWPTPGS